jgi:hypothetical protein
LPPATAPSRVVDDRAGVGGARSSAAIPAVREDGDRDA